MTFGDFICDSLIKKGRLPEGYRYVLGSEYLEGKRNILNYKPCDIYKFSFILDSTFEIITINIPIDLYKSLQRHYKLTNLINI